MPLEILIPLAIFLALLATFSVLLRRVWGLVLESRQLGSFRSTVRDLAGRLDETLVAITAQIDRLRRHQVDAAAISGSLDQTLALLPRLADEARMLRGPRGVEDARAALVAEIDRAERALQMVEHGCAILAAPGRDTRQPEAETAIKRGYLNVVHAREAIARHAEDIVAARPRGEPRWLSRRGVEKSR